MITLDEVAAAAGPEYRVERLGGNVHGVTDFRHMITLDGGATVATGDTATLWITSSETGEDVFTGEVTSAREVPTILAALA